MPILISVLGTTNFYILMLKEERNFFVSLTKLHKNKFTTNNLFLDYDECLFVNASTSK